MITINNDIQEEFCFLYGPDDVLVGAIKNYLAFLDVRVQVMEQNLEGYYLAFKGNKYEINKDGRIKDHPEDLFSTNIQSLRKLIKVQFPRRRPNHEIQPL
jgi:hypothetical protein